jgi:hypothetical protein
MLVTNQTTQDYYFGPLHLLAGVGETLTVDDTSDTSLYLTDDSVADAINNLYAAGKITVSSAATPFPRPTGMPEVLHGDGSPEGLHYAPQGSIDAWQQRQHRAHVPAAEAPPHSAPTPANRRVGTDERRHGQRLALHRERHR